MKKFHFSLQRVLRIKEIIEDQKKEALQTAYQKRETEKKQLDKLLVYKNELMYNLQAQRVEPTKIYQINHYYNYLDTLEGLIENQRARLNEAEKNLSAARDAWVEAKKEKKVLEKLKEKQKQKFDKEMLAHEQKILDDMSVQLSYPR